MLWSPVQTDTTQHGPARPLEPSPVPRVPSSPPRLRDTAASFPFAGSTSNEAEHLCQGHPGRTLIQPVTQMTTDKALLATAPTHRTQTAESPPALGLAETAGHCCRRTHGTLGVHKHIHTRTPGPESPFRCPQIPHASACSSSPWASPPGLPRSSPS